MRFIVIGSPRQRRDLREQLETSGPDVVGEFGSLAEARDADIAADAFLMATLDGQVRLKADTTPFIDEVGLTPVTPLIDDVRLKPDTMLIDETPEVETLTPREIEVLELVAEGLQNKAIAARLGISDQTVKFHLTSISGKLGAANRTDAVRRAVRRGLITL